MGKNDDYIIKQLTKEDLHLLPPLMKHCFGMDVEEAYFRWKFFDNPSGEVLGYFAVHQPTGEIAAYYGGIPMLFQWKKKTVQLYNTGDSMTHKSHRRKGLFSLLAKHWINELKKNDKLYAFAFSGPATTPGRLKLGFQPLSYMKFYFLPKQFSFLYRKNEENIEIIENYSKIEHLILKTNSSEIHSIKNKDIFKWRTSNPNFNYQTVAYKNEKGFTAFLTFYISGKTILIFDFYYEQKKHFKPLIAHLFREVKKNNLLGITAFVNIQSEYAKRIQKAGFISNPFPFGSFSEKRPVLILTKEGENDEIINGDWELSAFDYDAT